MKFTTFSERILESNSDDLNKVYLAVKRSSGHRWWSYKDFAADNFFVQITENTIDKVKINKDYPILCYNEELIETLLKDKRIKEENVYNLPKDIAIPADKAKFHKFIGDDENLPETVFSQDAAKKMTFPIIAKPSHGHSGEGIKIFHELKEFESADTSNFDMFSEFIDKKEEHRFILFKGESFFWMERKPTNDKAKKGKGDAKEHMMFDYIKRPVENIPEKYSEVITKYAKKLDKLPYLCFDVMEDKDGKVYIIEANTQPGVPFNSTVLAYEKIFEDFYGRPVSPESQKKLDELSKFMIKKTLTMDEGRFKIADK